MQLAIHLSWALQFECIQIFQFSLLDIIVGTLEL
jgi:hypothetical protein